MPYRHWVSYQIHYTATLCKKNNKLWFYKQNMTNIYQFAKSKTILQIKLNHGKIKLHILQNWQKKSINCFTFNFNNAVKTCCNMGRMYFKGNGLNLFCFRKSYKFCSSISNTRHVWFLCWKHSYALTKLNSSAFSWLRRDNILTWKKKKLWIFTSTSSNTSFRSSDPLRFRWFHVTFSSIFQ